MGGMVVINMKTGLGLIDPFHGNGQLISQGGMFMISDDGTCRCSVYF